MSDLSGYEAQLLLYVETRCVDHTGLLDNRHLNDEDRATLKDWNETGYVKSGRLVFKFIGGGKSIWSRMSEEAWKEAHRQRRLRAERRFSERKWQGTAEARGEGAIT